MGLFVCGFNGTAYLDGSCYEASYEDLYQFQQLKPRPSGSVLCAEWSTTVLCENRKSSCSFQIIDQSSMQVRPHNLKLRGSAVCAALLDDRMWILVSQLNEDTESEASHEYAVVHYNNDAGEWQEILHGQSCMSHVAVTSANRIAAAIRLSGGQELGCTSILEFNHRAQFLDWLQSDRKPFGSVRSFVIPGTCSSLMASAVSFTLLRAGDDEIFTWGDKRFPPLTLRSSDIETPGLADEISGFQIKKVATCSNGFVIAAVTRSGEAYLWGIPVIASGALETATDGTCTLEAAIQSGDGPSKVVLPGVPEADCDIVDIAVGAQYCLLLEKHTGVWVIGDNSNGQLGLGRQPRGVTAWTHLNGLTTGIKSVSAGDLTSFLVSEHPTLQ